MAALISVNKNEFGDHADEKTARKRSEGRLKDLNSCTDVRAWAIGDEERRLHMIDLIQAASTQGGTLGRYIPIDTIIDVLLASKTTDIIRLQRQVDELQKLIDIYNKLDLSDDQKRKLAQMKGHLGAVTQAYSAQDRVEATSEGSSRYQNAIDDFESVTTDYQDIRELSPTASPRNVTIGKQLCGCVPPKEKQSLTCAATAPTETQSPVQEHEVGVYVEDYDAPKGLKYDDMDADMLRNVLLDKEQEVAYAKSIALSALEKLEAMKKIMDTTNAMQQKLKQSQLKVASLQNEKLQQAKAFTESKTSQLAEKLDKEITLLQRKQDLPPEEKIEALERQIDVLKCYCTHMSAVEQEGEQMKKENAFFRNQLKKQSVIEEEIENQCNELEEKLSRSIQEISVLRERSQVLDDVILEKLTLEERLNRLAGVEDQLAAVKKRAEQADLLENENNRLREELKKYRDHYEYLSQDYDSLSVANNNSQACTANMCKEMTQLKAKLEEMLAQECQRNCEYNSMKKEMEEIAKKLEDTEKQSKELTEERDLLVEDLASAEEEINKAVIQINSLIDQINVLKRQTLDLTCINEDQEDEINVLISHIEHLSDVADSQQERVRASVAKMRTEIAHKDSLLASSCERLSQIKSYQDDMLAVQDELQQTIEGLEEEQQQQIYYDCHEAHIRCACNKDHIGDVMAESKKVVEYLVDKVQEMCDSTCPTPTICNQEVGESPQTSTVSIEEYSKLQIVVQKLHCALNERDEQDNERCCQLEFELQIEIANRVSLEGDNKKLKEQLENHTCQERSQDEQIVMTVSQNIDGEKEIMCKENQVLRYDIMRLETEAMTICKDLELLQNTNRKFETKIKDLNILTKDEETTMDAGDTLKLSDNEQEQIDAIELLENINSQKLHISLVPKTSKLKQISDQLNIQAKLLQTEIQFLQQIAPHHEKDILRLQTINKESQVQVIYLKNEIDSLVEETIIPPSDEDIEKLKKFIIRLQSEIETYKNQNQHLKDDVAEHRVARKESEKITKIETEILEKCNEIMEWDNKDESETNSDYKIRITNLETIVDKVKLAIKELESTVVEIRKDKQDGLKSPKSDLQKTGAKTKTSKQDTAIQTDHKSTCSIECINETSKLVMKVATLEILNNEHTNVIDTLKTHVPEVADLIKELEVNIAELQIDNTVLLNLISELDNELSRRKIDKEQNVPLSILLKSKMECDQLRFKVKELETAISISLQNKQIEFENQNNNLDELCANIAELQTENNELQNSVSKLQKQSYKMTTDLEKVIVASVVKNIQLENESSILKTKVNDLEEIINSTDNLLQEARISSTTKLGNVETKFASLMQESKDLRRKNRQIIEQNVHLKEEVNALQIKVTDLKHKNFNIKNEIRCAKEKHSESDIENIKSQREIQNLKQRIDKTEKDNADFRMENEKLKQVINKVENDNIDYIREIKDLQTKYENEQIIATVNTKKEKEALQDENIRMKQEIEDLKLKEQVLSKENDHLKMQLTDSQKVRLHMNTEIESLKQKVTDVAKEYDNLKAENIDLKQQITFNAENFITKLKELEEKITKLEQENTNLKQEAETMADVIKDLEVMGNKTDLEKENSYLRIELESIKQQLQMQTLALQESRNTLKDFEQIKQELNAIGIVNTRLQGERDKLSSEIDSWTKAIELLQQEQTTTQDEMNDLSEKLKTSASSQLQLEQEQEDKKKLKNIIEKLKSQIADLKIIQKETMGTDVNKLSADLQVEVQRLKTEKEEQKKEIEDKFTKSLSSVKEQYDRNAEYLRGSHVSAIARLQQEHEEEMNDISREHELEIANLQKLMTELMTDLETLKVSYSAVQDELDVYKRAGDERSTELIQNLDISFPKKDVGDKTTLTDGSLAIELQPIEKDKPTTLCKYEIEKAGQIDETLSSSNTTTPDPQEFQPIPEISKLPSNLDNITSKEMMGIDKLSLLRHIATMEENLTRKQNDAQQKLFSLHDEIMFEKQRLLEAKRGLVEERRTYNDLIERLRSKTREVADIEVERDLLRQRSYHNENRVRNLITEVENYRSTMTHLEEQLHLEKSAVRHLRNMQQIEKQRKF